MRVEIPNQISVKIGGIISRGVKAVEVSDEGKLIFTLTDGSTVGLGSVIGPAGPKGETGPAGPTGPAGAKGDTGAAGASIASIEKTSQSGTTSTYTITMSDGQTFEFEVQSDKGEKGDKGDTGATGPKGPQGEQGPAGIVVQETEPTGPEHPVWVNPNGGASDPGITGKDGTTFTPSVSASGDLSWTNDGGKENPETVNVKGPQGSPGITPNIQIGTVTTLPAGSDATASMGGTAENPTLNLGIPQGADGATGLPTVTADDNGKILRVVDGAWAVSDSGSTPTPTTYSVTLSLTNCTSSNTAASIQAGAAYSTTLTATTGYTLGTPTVTMGGADITASAWDASTGAISIAAVTGDIVITCTATTASTDTSPVIAGTGYSLGTDGGLYQYATAGACYTDFYQLRPAATKLTLYFADTENVSFSSGGKLQFWSPEAFLDFWSPASSRNQEKNYNIASGATKFRTSLAINGAEDSYAYDDTGHIYFAGKNTKYYGMSNINGTSDDGETVSTAAAVDDAVMAQALSSGETVNPAAYTGLTEAYVSMVQSNYDAFMAEVRGDYNKIPLIVHTDQHGRIGAGNQMMKLIGDLTDWYEISKCVNLGDTVADRFSATVLQTYFNAVKDHIPLSRRLEIYGNHDVWDADDDQKYIVDQKRLSPYFKNIYARRHGNNGYFTVIDDYYNVKYLVISDFEYPATNYATRRMTTAQASFLAAELGADDGYDIVLLSHVPLVMDDTVTSRDASYSAYTETFLSDATAQASLLAMLAARKSKSSGSFTDSEGVSHAYDFTGCTSELLISLHGHTHFEAYKNLSGSITEFAFDWFDGNTFYFAYIDRETKKFKCWKNESGTAALEIDIN